MKSLLKLYPINADSSKNFEIVIEFDNFSQTFYMLNFLGININDFKLFNSGDNNSEEKLINRDFNLKMKLVDENKGSFIKRTISVKINNDWKVLDIIEIDEQMDCLYNKKIYSCISHFIMDKIITL